MLLTGAFIWLPLDDMVVDGMFTWHLFQPQSVQGGLELAAIYVVVAGILLAFARTSPPFLLVLCIPLALYLRRHHVDLPSLAALLYLEMIVAVGRCVQKALRRPDREGLDGDLERFLAGIAVWALLALGLSGLGFGGPSDLRWAAAVLALAAFSYTRGAPLSYRLVRRLPALPRPHKLLAAFFLVHLACLLARTNVTVYHDSLWYSLRGEYVLAPEGGSLFQGLGLVHRVHYYPKLLELLTLPLSGLGDFSFILAFNVGLFTILLLTAFQLGRRLGLEPGLAMLGAGVAGSLPAVANIPLTGKPDLLAALLLCLAALYFWDHLNDRTWGSLLLGLAAVLLSLGTKITSLAYGTLLTAGVAAVVVWRRVRDRVTTDQRTGPTAELPAPSTRHRVTGVGLAVLVASLATLGLLTFRTYLLTGLPTLVPDQLAAFWERLGFSVRYPVGIVVAHRAESLSDIPALALDFLFHPTRLPLVRITWTGNSWLALLLAALPLWFLHGRKGPRIWNVVPWLPVLLAGVVFALAYNNAQRGGDGNYYMYPLVLATLLFFALAVQSARRERPVLVACMAAFIVVQTGIGFITAAWAPGTRTLDLDFTRSPFDTRTLRQQKLWAEGMEEIGQYLEGLRGLPRVVGLGPEDVTRWLPARFESLREISHSVPNPVGTPEDIVHFLKSQEIDHVLVPKVRRKDVFGATTAVLETLPGVVRVDGRLYKLLDLRAADLDWAAVESEIVAPGKVPFYDFVEGLPEALKRGQGPLQSPWGQAIARADWPTEHFTGAPSLVLVDGTEVSYALDLPAEPDLEFSAEVGLYPFFQVLGVSDGVMARVLARRADGQGDPVAAEIYVTPDTAFRSLEADLGTLSGHAVEITLSVLNREGGESEQDWVVWAGPTVAAQARSPGDSGARKPE